MKCRSSVGFLFEEEVLSHELPDGGGDLDWNKADWRFHAT